MKINKGDKAPNFTLRATDESEVSLHNFEGKNVLILFFPLAFTKVCTEALNLIRDEISIYEHLNTEVIAISVDSLFALRQFKKANNYTFLLLSDFNKIVSRAYDSFYEDFVFEMMGVTKSAAFLVDKSGIVQYTEVLNSPEKQPNFNAIKETLETL